MTIRKGEEWGRPAQPDEVRHCPTATRDRDVAATPGGTLLRGGDLGLTLGIAPHRSDTATWQRLPLDLLEVSFVDRRGRSGHATAAAWLTVGSFVRGPFVVVANASFVRGRRLFPRSHPNDGRFEVLEVSEAMSLRQRITAMRRVRSDSHLPHPQLTVCAAASIRLAWPRARKLVVDGRRLGTVREIDVVIRPDAGITHVAA